MRIRNYILNGDATIGNWSFNGQYTGDGTADFLLGWLHAAYLQDACKISPKLTVNLGIRYEVGLPFYDTQTAWPTSGSPVPQFGLKAIF